MAINHTGHAEIDQQHELLDSLVGQLAAFCQVAEQRPEATCEACAQVKQRHCRTTLISLAGELAAFLAGHAAYEEKMMELLPDTLHCQAHVKAHKSAHEGIARQLKKLSQQAGEANPRTVGNRMWQVVGDWLGHHSAQFDTRLVRLGLAGQPGIDFDGELVAMLDQHVFPNRPTRQKTAAHGGSTLSGKKLEIRGRFETLSPAQRSVFRLVIGGKTNRDIAATLAISVNTVKTHRAAVFQKMDVSSVLDLVKKADVLR